MDEQRMKALQAEMHKEYPEFIAFFTKHGRSLAAAAVLAVALVAAVHLFRTSQRTGVNEAAAALAQAKSLEDLEKITAEYKSTPSAPIALITLAKGYFDSGDYDMALNKYMEFLKSFPKHPLTVSAELNRVSCLEARGQTQEAMTGYEDFLMNNPENFLTTEALFGKARCFAQQGDMNKAKAIYENYIVQNPRGAWFSRAEESLEDLERLIAKTPAEKPAVTTP